MSVILPRPVPRSTVQVHKGHIARLKESKVGDLLYIVKLNTSSGFIKLPVLLVAVCERRDELTGVTYRTWVFTHDDYPGKTFGYTEVGAPSPFGQATWLPDVGFRDDHFTCPEMRRVERVEWELAQ